MFAAKVYVLIAALLVVATRSETDVNFVLPPVVNNTDLPEKLMVYVPGGNVPNVNYTDTLRSIQRHATDVQLTVAVLGFRSRLCIQLCPSSGACFLLHNQVQDAIAQAVEEAGFGGSTSDDVLVGAHSLGGTCANYLVQGYPDVYTHGLVLHGGYVDEAGDGSLPTFPSPTLLVGAELDGGLARPGKLATWYRQYAAVAAAEGQQAALRRAAVHIIPSIDHSDFCQGFQVPGDLPSELEPAEAVEVIGQTSGAWLNYLVAGNEGMNGLELLEDYSTKTKLLLTPFFEAQDLELMPDGDHLVDPTGTYSPWCERAQMILAGLSDADSARVTIARTCDVAGFEDSRSCAYLNSTSDFEHSRSQYAFDTATGTLAVNVSGHNVYYRDFDNTGELTSAKEIGCKMLSGARIAEQLGLTDYPSDVSVGSCADANRAAVQAALDLTKGTVTRERYEARGRSVCFGDDFDAFFSAGPAWIHESLELKFNETCMIASSVKISTTLDSNLFPGVHYCKLLSPARVVDWMMTDSLQSA